MAINIAELEVLLRAVGIEETTDALKDVDDAGQEAADGLGDAAEGAKGLGDAAKKAAPGLGLVNSHFAKLSLNIAGVNPKLSQLILTFVKTNAILITVTVAVAALIVVYNLLKTKTDEAAAAQKKLNEELAKEFDAAQAATLVGLQEQLRQTTEQILEIDKQRAALQDKIEESQRHFNGNDERTIALKKELKDLDDSTDTLLKARFVITDRIGGLYDKQKATRAEQLRIETALIATRNAFYIEAIKFDKQLTDAFLTEATARLTNLELQQQSVHLTQEQMADLQTIENIFADQENSLRKAFDLKQQTSGLLIGEMVQLEQRIVLGERDLAIAKRRKDFEAEAIVGGRLETQKQRLQHIRELLIEQTQLEQKINDLVALRLRIRVLDQKIIEQQVMDAIGTLPDDFHVDIPVELQAFMDASKLKEDLSKQLEDNLDASFVQGIGNVVADSFKQGFARANIGKVIMAAFGAMMVEQGKMLLSYGLIISGLSKLLTNIFTAGPAAIAAGIALIGLGSEFGAIADRTGNSKGRGSTGATGSRGTGRIPDETVRTRIPTGGLELATTASLPSGNTFVVIGPNDAQAQDQIVKLLKNAQRRGHSI